MRDDYRFKVDVPVGTCGDWSIERVTVSREDEQFSRLRAALNHNTRYVTEGRYTCLKRGGETIMSDTPAERRDHWEPIARGVGHCLVNGLGLGMVANAMLMTKAERVTVIESSADVIALVAGHYVERWGDRFQVIHADAFEYQPPRGIRYGYVWHDIWDSICGDNIEGMKRLHRKYGRRCESQGSWCRLLCEANR